MDCHLFCHNEVPTAMMMVPFIGASLGAARAWLRRRLKKTR